MSTETIELCTDIAAPPQAVFDAWMSARKHAAFTGAPTVIQPRAGTRISAWDGYIHGWVLKVGPGRRARFAWRTSDFAPTDPDSIVDLWMRPVKGGTCVEIAHREIPADQGARYMKGWEDFYFAPLTKYFAAAKKPTVKKPAARKKA